jgi:hypothetical protein
MRQSVLASNLLSGCGSQTAAALTDRGPPRRGVKNALGDGALLDERGDVARDGRR